MGGGEGGPERFPSLSSPLALVHLLLVSEAAAPGRGGPGG